MCCVQQYYCNRSIPVPRTMASQRRSDKGLLESGREQGRVCKSGNKGFVGQRRESTPLRAYTSGIVLQSITSVVLGCAALGTGLYLQGQSTEGNGRPSGKGF